MPGPHPCTPVTPAYNGWGLPAAITCIPSAFLPDIGLTPAFKYTIFPNGAPPLNVVNEALRLAVLQCERPIRAAAMGRGGAYILPFNMFYYISPLPLAKQYQLFAATFNVMQLTFNFPPNAYIQYKFMYFNNFQYIIWRSSPMFPLAQWNTPAQIAQFQSAITLATMSSNPLIIMEIQWYIVFPDPGGGANTHRLPIKDMRKKKTRDKNRIQIIRYGDDDKTCAQRALVTQWKYLQYMNTDVKERTVRQCREYRLLRERHTGPDSATGRYLMGLVEQLTKLSGVPTTRNTDFKDMEAFAQALSTLTEKKCCIRIYSASKQLELEYSTVPMDAIPKDIDDYWMFNLCLHEGHYTVITKIHRLMYDARKECRRCNVFYHSTHKCNKFGSESCMGCTLCFCTTFDHYSEWARTKDRTHWQTCDDCHRSFYGEECFLQHKVDRSDTLPSSCNTKWKCTQCERTFFYPNEHKGMHVRNKRQTISQQDHTCGDEWCNNCAGFQSKSHQCYIKPTPLEPQKPGKYIFADFECTQDISDDKYHSVNLAVSISSEGTQWVHRSIAEWCDFMLNPQLDGYIFIFHYGKGYDFQFILEYLTQHSTIKLTINPIFVGGKVLSFTVGKKKSKKVSKTTRIFKCSHNMIPMSLDRFTTTFGLTAKKGYCPHLFNTAEHANYIGPMPPKEDFMYQYMTPKKLADFNQWYEERARAGPWNQAKELLEYCIDDVKLLKEGCMAFNDIVLELTQGTIEPFRDCITIASLTQLMYKSMFLKPDTLPALHTEDIIRMRPAFKGGRTGGTYCYYEAVGDEKIFYDDVTSMYPYVNAYRPYPIGFPVFHSEEDKNMDAIDLSKLGVWCVDVDCPTDLFHPLLPTNRNGLLMFDLTPKRNECFASPELKKAVELGYTITKIHWVYQWDNSRDDLFREYIDTFLKLKQQASGWPSPDMSEDDKQAYIQDYKLRQGVSLDYDQVATNPGMRSVAKLALNSFWGKFGQRLGSDYVSTDILFDTPGGRQKFNRIMVKPDNIVTFNILENALMLKHKTGKEKPFQPITNTCLPVAIFTTCYARLHLYTQLERLQDQVIYYDTDSIIYVVGSRFPQPEIPKGVLLGEWTSETPGDFIRKVAVGGPKNYAYITNNDCKEVVKVKGHSLGSVAAAHFTFDIVYRAVFSQSSIGMTLPQLVRQPDLQIRTVNQTKLYRFRFDKRKIEDTVFQDEKRQLPWYVRTTPWVNETEANAYRVKTISNIASIHSEMDDKSMEAIRRTIKQLRNRKRKHPDITFPWVRVLCIKEYQRCQYLRDVGPPLFAPSIHLMDEPDYMRFAMATPKREIIAHIEGFVDKKAALSSFITDEILFPGPLSAMNIHFNRFLMDMDGAQQPNLMVFVHMDHISVMDTEARKEFLASIPTQINNVHVL